jgi:hypothetical protein
MLSSCRTWTPSQNVAELGGSAVDVVAAYLTNLRVMQEVDEEDDAPAVSPALIQPRHTATLASVAAKARALLAELAQARTTVKPRKAPKNKAVESAVRAAAAAVASGGPAASQGGAAHSSQLDSEPVSTAGAEDATSDMPSDGSANSSEDTLSSECNDDFHSVTKGHLDTGRSQGPDGSSQRTAFEEEERLLLALQGPAGTAEMLRLTRAQGGVPVLQTS